MNAAIKPTDLLPQTVAFKLNDEVVQAYEGETILSLRMRSPAHPPSQQR